MARLPQIYALSIILAAALQFPRSMGDLLNYITLVSISLTLLFSAILILKKKEMGWFLFIGTGGVLIAGQLAVILIFKPQGLWLKFAVYTIWWGIGFAIYLKQRTMVALN